MQKIVYLTIDDAPSETFLPKMEYLHAHRIPAVFFCQGNFLEQRPDFARQAIRRGFVLGNHAYDHPHFSELTLDQCREQILRTDQIIDDLYASAGVERPARWFRFPYGDKGGLLGSEWFEPYSPEGAARKAALQEYLRGLGYTRPAFERVTYPHHRAAGLLDDVDWTWTYDVLEWTIHREPHLYGVDSLEKLYERMDQNEPLEGRGLNDFTSPEEIILTHDHPETSEMFPLILERLQWKGLIFAELPLM